MEKEKTLDLEIAILGGGFAGVYCGKSLVKRLGADSKAKTGLISDENYMVFQPMLPEVASASISPRHVVNPIRHLCRGLSIYKADVEKIDVKNKQLTVSPGPYSPKLLIRFKHLVVALGAKVDLSRVPGMPEHAYLMQNVGDAMKLRATVIARFEEANLVTDPEKRQRLLTFVVVGGGYSGVETAGQILDLFQAINPYYRNVGPEDFHVHLVHSRDHLLPTLSLKLGKYAENILRERGLKIHLNHRVKSLTANRVFLDDGSTIESNTVVSTVGNAPHPLIGTLAEEAGIETERGRLKTRETMQVPGYDWLWATGDCAAVPLPGGGSCPPTAQFAMRQGTLLGKNLSAFLRAESLKPFTFTGFGELAAIGHHRAVAEVFGFKFSGFIAWWMWRTIYLSKLPGMDRKLRVLIDWTLDFFFPRDINLLSPRYSRTLQEAYLEKGDILFHTGEPAFSFYIVKDGCIRITDKEGELIKTVSAGDFFGERALLSDQKWHFDATAAEDTTLVGLGSQEFKAILENSRIMRKMLQRSARQYRSSGEIDEMLSTIPENVLGETAKTHMSAEVIQIPDNEPVRETLRRLNNDRHSFYPVIDANSGQYVGVLPRDVFYDFIQMEGLKGDTAIADLDLVHLPRIEPDTSIKESMEAMVRGGSNKILIVDGNNVPVGILSIRDILEAAIRE